MIYVYPFFAVASFLFSLVARVLAPFLSPAADADGKLPDWLAWFQTFDASLDEGWKGGYFPLGWGGLWWARTRWLWRNPGYGFDLWLGVTFVPGQWNLIRYDDRIFFAYNPTSGAFNWTYTGIIRIKLGWKAWNHFDPATRQWIAGNWATFPNIPVVFSISRGPS